MVIKNKFSKARKYNSMINKISLSMAIRKILVMIRIMRIEGDLNLDSKIKMIKEFKTK